MSRTIPLRALYAFTALRGTSSIYEEQTRSGPKQTSQKQLCMFVTDRQEVVSQ